MRVDPSVKSNIDRMDARKMNRFQRVQSLPERGGGGDGVVVSVNGVDVAYAWVDGAWVSLGTGGEEGVYPAELGAPFDAELGDPFDVELGDPFSTALGE